jgi:hypothetical protein
VNRVVPAEALDAEVARLASIILARSGKVVATGKRAFYRQIDSLWNRHMRRPRSRCLQHARTDAAEGIDAFIEKRPARWAGALMPCPRSMPPRQGLEGGRNRGRGVGTSSERLAAGVPVRSWSWRHPFLGTAVLGCSTPLRHAGGGLLLRAGMQERHRHSATCGPSGWTCPPGSVRPSQCPEGLTCGARSGPTEASRERASE